MNAAPLHTSDALEQAESLLDRGGQLERAGKAEEALEVLLRAQSLVAGHDRQPLQADLLYRTAVLRTRLGQTERAEELFHQSLETATWCNYLKGQAWAVNGLAIIAQRRGETELSESQFRRARRLASDAGEHRLLGILEMNLGVVANIRGDLDSALIHYEKSLEAFGHTDDSEGTCWALNNLGMLQTDLRRYEDSEKTLTRGLKLAKKMGDRVMEGMLELNRVEALIGLEKWRRAKQGCKRALKIAENRGDTLQTAQCLKFLGIVERSQGRPDDATTTLERAAELAARVEDRLLGAEVTRELGETWLQLGDTNRARRAFGTALQAFVELDAVLDATDLRQRLDESFVAAMSNAPQTAGVSA